MQKIRAAAVLDLMMTMDVYSYHQLASTTRRRWGGGAGPRASESHRRSRVKQDKSARRRKCPRERGEDEPEATRHAVGTRKSATGPIQAAGCERVNGARRTSSSRTPRAVMHAWHGALLPFLLSRSASHRRAARAGAVFPRVPTSSCPVGRAALSLLCFHSLVDADIDRQVLSCPAPAQWLPGMLLSLVCCIDDLNDPARATCTAYNLDKFMIQYSLRTLSFLP